MNLRSNETYSSHEDSIDHCFSQEKDTFTTPLYNRWSDTEKLTASNNYEHFKNIDDRENEVR